MKFFSIWDSSKERDMLKHGRFFIAAGATFAALMLVGAGVFGINWGIDFAGGIEMQVKLQKAVTAEELRTAVEKIGVGKHQIQQLGDVQDNEWLVRVERVTAITDEQLKRVKGVIEKATGKEVALNFDARLGDRFTVVVPAENDAAALDAQDKLITQAIVDDKDIELRKTKAVNAAEDLDDAVARVDYDSGKATWSIQVRGVADRVAAGMQAALGDLEVRRADFVDATVAQELKTDGIIALVLSLALILVYVALRFDLFFAPGAVIALLHDPLGALAVYVIGRLEFDLPSIAALLTTVGYSISHTIVIYDRVRATMPPLPPSGIHDQATVRAVVNKAVNDTMSRTINTTITVLCTTIAIWVLAHGSLRAFAACLTVGCAIGAYSSAFMAPTIYLWFREKFARAPSQSEGAITRADRERGVV